MLGQTSDNNKRLAKNTLLLYFRMFFIMAVSLFTSRVVLKTLGVEDFGIYNVVGGVVAMFGFLNSAMSSTTQRYITFALGKGDEIELRKVFSSCILTHFVISIVVLILAESIGLWFLYNKMVIPADRMFAAFWVFQCSVISSIVLIMSIPYNADIIAHEKMAAFAYISLVEVFLKLLIVYFLYISAYDKLIVYAILILIIQCFIRSIYTWYCKKHFKETLGKLIYNYSIFRELLSFASWNLYGNLAAILFTQGLNILLNIFFGPVINAARGVALQVQTAVSQFASNFQMALNPQITKSYAQNDLKNMHSLVYRSSKFTFFLLLILIMPFFFEADFILGIWLSEVPLKTVVFLRLMLIIIMIDALVNPLMVSAAATGKIKKYQTIVGGILLSIVPIAYIVLKNGGKPESVFIVQIVIYTIAFGARLLIIKKMIALSITEYIKTVLIRCFIVLFFSILIPLVLSVCLNNTLIKSLSIIGISILSSLIASFFVGLTSNEKKVISNKIYNYCNHFK